MIQEFTNLLSPGRIGNIKLRNRVIFLPHYTALGTDEGMPSKHHAYYFAERGKGGAALVVMESQAVHPTGKMAKKFIEAYDPRVIPYYTEISNMVHETGAFLFGQLTHAGHTTLERPPRVLWAPTQMPEPSSFYNTKEISLTDIQELISGFAAAAKNQMEAGFDGVEVKVAHDGLLRSFVSPYFNRRTDIYGGNYDNRVRICLEVFEAIKKTCGDDYPLGVRLCLDEYTDWGYSLDFGVKLAETFASSGLIDYISTDAGSFSSFYMEIPPMYVPPDFAIYLSAAVKEVVDIPVVAFGRINDAVQAEKILENREADFIGMCRQLICDPFFVNKILENRMDEIRQCIACNEGCNAPPGRNQSLGCIQNPAAGREERYGSHSFHASVQRKKILIIGGGPAGLKAAETSAKRGHSVELVERSSELGGQVRLAAKIPYRSEVFEVIRYLYQEVQRMGIKLHMNTEADIDLVKTINPDIIIVATGSTPYMPGDPWVQQPNVFSARQVMEQFPIKDSQIHIALFDRYGYWDGVGVAEYILDKGKRVTVITPHLYVGMELESTHQPLLYKRLFEKNIEFICHMDIVDYSSSDLRIANIYTGQESVVSGIDTLVLAYGSRSCTDLYEQLKVTFPDVYIVGDAVSPRRIQQVIAEAFELSVSL